MSINVGLLGCTGMVGQRFLQLLDNHPWFNLIYIAASERSQGKVYGNWVKWYLDKPMPENVKDLEIGPLDPKNAGDCKLIFSALPASVAKTVEVDFAKDGYFVASNASAFREHDDVPLMIPEINPHHLDLIPIQQEKRGWSGAIVTNPNCTTVGLTMTLKPLYDSFNLSKVLFTSCQALSGAGFSGIPSMAIIDNMIPFISGEEEKCEWEPGKILGKINGDKIERVPLSVSATCTRVPVRDGHLESVWVDIDKDPDEIKNVFTSFKGEPQKLGLPTAPESPIIYKEEPDRPQPYRDRDAGNGMGVSVGRIRKDPILGTKYVCLVHNTIRGAAGASILNGELMVKKGFL